MEDRGEIVSSQHYHAGQLLKRSSHWAHVRNQFVEDHKGLFPEADHLEVHHIVPFHLCVLLGLGYAELDPRNLIVLPRMKEDIHLLIGHLGTFKSWNPHVVAMFTKYGKMTADEIQADHDWQTAHMHRPRDWEDMTDHDKKATERLIHKLCPIRRSS